MTSARYVNGKIETVSSHVSYFCFLMENTKRKIPQKVWRKVCGINNPIKAKFVKVFSRFMKKTSLFQ